MAQPVVAVVGTLTRDTTQYVDGTRTENLGGVYYTVCALAGLFGGAARIVPVANVGADAAAQLHAALDLPGVDRAQLRTVDSPNNHVYLTYTGPHERREVLHGLVPPVSAAQVRNVSGADHVIVNLTSGRDIELESLQQFRAAFGGRLQLDVHSLTLGFGKDGVRFLERPADWQRWVACVDWVQMNEVEANLLADGSALATFARDVLDLGPRGVVITLGDAGCVYALRHDPELHRLETHRHPQPAYPTGCGDVFGAALAYALVRGAEAAGAVEFANAVAGRKAGFEPPVQLLRLQHHAAADIDRWIPHAK